MHKCSFTAVGVLSLALAGVACAGEQARAWLDRMNTVLEQGNYVGTFVHISEQRKAEAMHVAHRYVDGEVHERIVTLDGIGREIIRRDEDVRCILPDREIVLHEKANDSNPLVAALPSYSQTLEAHYQLKVFNIDRVAGRKTQVIGISPRDDYRYGYVLWLDWDTAMPLRSRSWGDDKQIIEEILFTSIQFPDDVPDAAFQQTVNTDGFTQFSSYGPGDELAPGVPWRVSDLPEGFELAVSTHKSTADSKYPVEHLVYSDGLATVSVFIESPNAETDVAEGFSRAGSTNAYSLTVDGRKVTAMGEVPRRTVEAIATSIRAHQD